MPNVYGSPEKFGLTPIDELELNDYSYEFDIVAVWKHGESGKIYLAADSGCSCPSPFEDFTSLEELEEIVSMQPVRDAVKGATVAPSQVQDFLRKVEAAIR